MVSHTHKGASRLVIAVIAALAVGLVGPSGAHAAAGISLSTSPAPPEVVYNNGSASQRSATYSGVLTYDTAPSQYVVEIEDPSGAVVSTNTFPITNPTPGAGSPRTFGPSTYTVAPGGATGRWVVRVTYLSIGGPPLAAGGDAQAERVFFVANAVGQLTITKFEDLNANGQRDAGEPGVANWGFQVQSPLPGGGTTTNPVTTAGDGNRVIGQANVGTYQISEVQQAGWQATTPSSGAVTLAANGSTGSFVVGNARLVNLCGTVYLDPNRSGGVREPGEVGKEGVTLALNGASGLGVTVPANTTTTTDANGRYCFSNLMPGTYNVRESVPGGFEATGDLDGPANGADLINPIRLVSGQPSDNNDFGLATPVGPGRICGTVFIDPDRDGRKGFEEKPKEGVVLTLGSGATTRSDANGRYCFEGLPPGAYNVRETVPSPLEATNDADGPSNGRSYINPITVIAGQTSDGNDFGLFEPTRLSIVKKASVKRVRQGRTVTYTLTVCNRGGIFADNVVIEDPLMASTTIAKRGGAIVRGGALVWRAGDLAVGKCTTKRFTLRFDRDARTGRHVNRATADADNADLVRASVTVTVTRTPRPPKRIVVTG